VQDAYKVMTKYAVSVKPKCV